jgi:glycine dehydrogenase subunit 2
MKLIFERSIPGRKCSIIPECDVPVVLPASLRSEPLRLPELSENDISRHYTELARHAHGVNNGPYPLGSCTMKYNPKIDDQMACLPEFTRIHPLQEPEYTQGCLEVLFRTGKLLQEITGMDAMTFEPAAGAHGELTGLLVIRAYHESRGDLKRTKIIVPDSAHGTNPASAAMAGFEVVNIPSAADGCVDLDALRLVAGPDTAGLMLTNPNTVGLFDRNIRMITEIVHAAGGLCYYDGANLNPVLGIARPGDMGFDTVHVNLHKSFATPHGGGGPGSGPVGCKMALKPFLPGSEIREEHGAYTLQPYPQSIGRVRSFSGNFLVIVRALTYLLVLGRNGLSEAGKNAVLNANYLRTKLSTVYHPSFAQTCMHEFVLSLEEEKSLYGVSALDVAKSLIDYGIHPPTMYFPLIVHEALMIEPTETESKETLDEFAAVMTAIHEKIQSDPEAIKSAPHTTPVKRLDEVLAARHPVVRFDFEHASPAV